MKIEITNQNVIVYTMGKTITVSLTPSKQKEVGYLVAVNDRLEPGKETFIIQ